MTLNEALMGIILSVVAVIVAVPFLFRTVILPVSSSTLAIFSSLDVQIRLSVDDFVESSIDMSITLFPSYVEPTLRSISLNGKLSSVIGFAFTTVTVVVTYKPLSEFSEGFTLAVTITVPAFLAVSMPSSFEISAFVVSSTNHSTLSVVLLGVYFTVNAVWWFSATNTPLSVTFSLPL